MMRRLHKILSNRVAVNAHPLIPKMTRRQDYVNPTTISSNQGRQQAKKRGGGLTTKKGTFSNLIGHLTLPKPNPPLKTPRISATSFFDFD